MDNFDKNIHCELTDISKQEILAVFTLMNMLKRKREMTKWKIPVQNISTIGKSKMEIDNKITCNKRRRCHSL
jgi:hypothetical protein